MAERITIRGIWSGMDDDAAATVLGDVKRVSPDLYREALAGTAGAFRMRPDALRQQPVARQAATIRRALTQVNREEIGARLLIDWLGKTQQPMLAQFLDDLGIEHEDGMVKEGVGAEPEPERLRAAIAHLRETFPPSHVQIYLQAFAVITADEWEGLPEAIEGAPTPGPPSP